MILSDARIRSQAHIRNVALFHGIVGVLVCLGLLASLHDKLSAAKSSHRLTMIVDAVFVADLPFLLPWIVLLILAQLINQGSRWPFFATIIFAAIESGCLIVGLTIGLQAVHAMSFNVLAYIILLAAVNLALLPIVASCINAISSPSYGRRRASRPVAVRVSDRSIVRRSERLHKCPQCGHPMRVVRWRCPKCRHTLSMWTLPTGMLSDFARRSPGETRSFEGENNASLSADAEYRAKANAARFLIEQSGRTNSDNTDRCLTDLPFARRLYFAAAKRLHPDRNGGVHLREWFQLQQAAATLWQQ
jgi:ribosomal protein L37AE/L43A